MTFDQKHHWLLWGGGGEDGMHIHKMFARVACYNIGFTEIQTGEPRR